MQKMLKKRVQSVGHEDPAEEETASHSSILTWRMPWTEGPGWATVHGHDLATNTATHTPAQSLLFICLAYILFLIGVCQSYVTKVYIL